MFVWALYVEGVHVVCWVSASLLCWGCVCICVCVVALGSSSGNLTVRFVASNVALGAVDLSG